MLCAQGLLEFAEYVQRRVLQRKSDGMLDAEWRACANLFHWHSRGPHVADDRLTRPGFGTGVLSQALESSWNAMKKSVPDLSTWPMTSATKRLLVACEAAECWDARGGTWLLGVAPVRIQDPQIFKKYL